MDENIISEFVSPSGKWRLIVAQRDDGRFTYRCQIAEDGGWGPSGDDAGVYDSAETAELEARAKMAEAKFPNTIAWMPPIKVYAFKHYRRTCRDGTTGELIEKIEIQAAGLAYASKIAERDYLPAVNFKTDFAILEGETGFVTCWFRSPQ